MDLTLCQVVSGQDLPIECNHGDECPDDQCCVLPRRGKRQADWEEYEGICEPMPELGDSRLLGWETGRQEVARLGDWGTVGC